MLSHACCVTVTPRIAAAKRDETSNTRPKKRAKMNDPTEPQEDTGMEEE